MMDRKTIEREIEEIFDTIREKYLRPLIAENTALRTERDTAEASEAKRLEQINGLTEMVEERNDQLTALRTERDKWKEYGEAMAKLFREYRAEYGDGAFGAYPDIPQPPEG